MQELGVDLATTYRAQERAQDNVANLQFYSRDQIFINIAKEVYIKNYTLLYSTVSNNFKVETYLQKRYYLEFYIRTQVELLVDSKLARGSLQVITYLQVTIRDLVGLTLLIKLYRQENINRLVYLQFYSTIKLLFNISKIYVFNNQAVKNLALNPSYVCLLQKQGSRISFNKKSYIASYLYSKKYTTINLRDSQQQLYRPYKEYYVSLAIIDKIYKLQQ